MKHLPSNFRYSFSKLAGYIECPRSFYLTYIENDREEPLGNYYSEYGSFLHLLLQQWAEDYLPAICLADAWRDGYEDNVKLPPPPYPKGQAEKNYQLAIDYLDNFTGFGDDWEVLSVERKFVIRLNDSYDVSGIADLVLRNTKTGDIHIIDHKTKSASSMTKEISLYRKQLYLYAQWCFEEYHQYPKLLSFNMIKTQEMITEEFSEEELNKSIKWFIDTIHQIEESDVFEMWDCKINKFFCSNLCDVFQSCPEWLEVKQADYEKWLAKKKAEEDAALGYS